MKKIVYAIVILLCTGYVHHAYADLYPPLSAEDQAAYNNLITQEVQKADAASFSALEQIRSSPSMSIGDVAALNALVTCAQVKHTLANNFLNTPSMNSPVVRNAFLSLMQQQLISESDLTAFQALVNSEKAKMAAAPATP